MGIHALPALHASVFSYWMLRCHRPAQRLLEAERRFAEKLKRQEEAVIQLNRKGMLQAHREQTALGDKFWGFEIREALEVRGCVGGVWRG